MPIIGQVDAYLQGRQDAEDDRPVGAERMPTAVISAYWQGFSIRRAEMREDQHHAWMRPYLTAPEGPARTDAAVRAR
jgi:hypothetical protein